MRETFGNYLKHLRLQHKLTQMKVAEHLDISRQAYAYYERNNTAPGIDLLIGLSELYQVPLQTFYAYVPNDSELIMENSGYHS